MQQATSPVHYWYQELWNNQREEIIDEMAHPQVEVFGLGEVIKGIDGFKEFYHAFKRDFSNIHVVVESVHQDGETYTGRCKVTATHAPTGKPVEFFGITIAEFSEGKMTKGWNSFDFLTMNLQLGKITPQQLA